MRRLSYVAPRELRWEDAPAPRLPSDYAVLARPLTVATCDLDALIVEGLAPFPAPFPIGHECVAEITDVGDAVTHFRPGDRVSIPFQISCGSCPACLRQRTANCQTVPRMSTYGFGPAVGMWGGFLADRVLVPYADHMLVAVDDGISGPNAASVSDNISDAWRAVAPLLREDPGAPVLVIGGGGAGSIGLYAVAVAVALGASAVHYADPDPGRQRTATRLGAQTVQSPWPRRLGPFPITVDANGTPGGLQLALRSTAPDGTCTSTAIYFGEEPQVPMLEMYTKCTTLRAGRAHVRAAMPHVLELLRSGTLDPSPVTSRQVSVEDAVDALLETGWTKLIIDCDSGRDILPGG